METNKFLFLFLLFSSCFILLLFGSYQLVSTDNVERSSLPKSSPAPALQAVAPETVPIQGTLPRNSTLEQVLSGLGVTAEEVHQLIQEVRPVYNLNSVMAGQRFEIERARSGALKTFRYAISDEDYLIVQREGNSFGASRHRYAFQVLVEEIYGRIDDSLYNTLVSRGEKDQLVQNLLDILRWDVDFTDIQPEDSFKVIVEKKYLDGEFVKYGNILAAEFRSGKTSFYGFLFEDPRTGEKKYYDSHGKAVRKAFLKVPFRFDPRITSRFSHSRYHPILKTRRPHLGVDYGAPSGSAVLASGSGTVSFAGRNGGYGKFVQIRHSNDIVTSYAHLSSIRVRAGQKVVQGQVIGRVGSTGLATGPHLDYRVQQRGRFVDPSRLTLAYSADAPIGKQHWQEFIAVRDAFRQRLASIPEDEPYLNRVAGAGG